jgi:hypothetical protein
MPRAEASVKITPARVAGTVDLGIQDKAMKMRSLIVYFFECEEIMTAKKRISCATIMQTKELPTSDDRICEKSRAAPMVPKRKG